MFALREELMKVAIRKFTLTEGIVHKVDLRLINGLIFIPSKLVDDP